MRDRIHSNIGAHSGEGDAYLVTLSKMKPMMCSQLNRCSLLQHCSPFGTTITTGSNDKRVKKTVKYILKCFAMHFRIMLLFTKFITHFWPLR